MRVLTGAQGTQGCQNPSFWMLCWDCHLGCVDFYVTDLFTSPTSPRCPMGPQEVKQNRNALLPTLPPSDAVMKGSSLSEFLPLIQGGL